jgi:hypothetical protein
VGVQRAIRGLVALLVASGCALAATAPPASASLSVPTGGPPSTFTGSGTAGVQAALANFEAAVGGVDNGTEVGEQGRGFRHANWDGLAVDGSEAGSTVIASGVATAPPSSLQPWGLEVGPEIAVANDGFQSVGSAVTFTPFSSPNVWGPYNSSSGELDIVAPAGQGSTATPALTRGLGLVVLDASGSTEIQYYNGDSLLGSVSAPTGTTSTWFGGLLFPDPVVNRVVVQFGGGDIFDYDGTTVTGNGSSPAAGDDVVLGEPAPARPTVTATAGIAISPVLDTFTNTESQATAVIDWGDGTRSAGTIVPAAGGAFNVTGTHAFLASGSYTATVTVSDFAGDEQTSQTTIQVGPRATATSLTCTPTTVAVSASTACTAIVSDIDAGNPIAPTGPVTFSSPTAGAVFPAAGSCILGPIAAAGTSLCVVQFEPGQLPPVRARITATYAGDDAHLASDTTTSVAVHAQRCSVSALSRRLRPGGFGVIVTCDARANVRVAAEARVARRGGFRAFQLTFGSAHSLITPGRPTVLVIKAPAAVLSALRAALRRHQHVSLKLTLTAASHSTRTTTTKRVSAISAG